MDALEFLMDPWIAVAQIGEGDDPPRSNPQLSLIVDGNLAVPT